MTNNEESWEIRLTRIEEIVEFNAKAIQLLSNHLTFLSDEVRMTQRQLQDGLRRIDDNSADIRLQIENQRILRNLENRVRGEERSHHHPGRHGMKQKGKIALYQNESGAFTKETLKAAIIGKTWRVKRTDLEQYMEKIFDDGFSASNNGIGNSSL